MNQLFYLLSATVRGILLVIRILLMGRAVISWLPIDEDNPIVSFLYAVTEPVLLPVRSLFEVTGWFQGLPIDMSFLVTFIILSILSAIL